jgi:hypothetical protein
MKKEKKLLPEMGEDAEGDTMGIFRLLAPRGSARYIGGFGGSNEGKKMMKHSLFLTVVFACLVAAPLSAQPSEDASGRWSAQRANDW